ncbi:MAG: asparaginase [Actinobacteria bacterium]|nr:asparaginase [Actinomycetota bacterium]
MDPIVVEVRRNGFVEARHRVHAVAVRDGEIVAAAGDPHLTCFMRSSSKPIQALPLARARGDLDERDLAIASASHRADDDQLAAVRALLAKAPATEEDLECGLQEGRPPHRIDHNCSGKHSGMLALCRAYDWPTLDYRLPDHPVQRACLAAHVEATQSEPLATATDGCGVVTFAYPLERMAHAFSRLPQLDRGDRVTRALRAHPALVGGPDGADVRLMHRRPTWYAKGGAEGLLCAGDGDLGVALKAEDGASRPLGPALAAFLDVPDLATDTLRNSRGEVVGEIGISVFTNL